MSFKERKSVMNKIYEESSVEIREKRINIVFKVLYVFAIAFGTIFLNLAKSFSTTLNGFYLIESCLLSLLLVVIVYIVFYIINEMQCLKIGVLDYKKEDHDKQFEHMVNTENSYNCIFIVFASCFMLFLAVLFCGVFLPDDFYKIVNSEVLTGIFAGCATLCTMCQIIKYTKEPILKTPITNKQRNALTIFSSVGGQGAVLAIFCLMALPN